MVTFDMMGPATILVLFSKTVAVAMLALTLLSFGGQFSFLLDNLSNFRLQFALVLVFCGVFLLCTSDRAWWLAVGVGAIINFVPVLPWILPASVSTQTITDRSVRILVSNVYLRNTDYDRMSELLREIQPDILGLIEVNQGWLSGVPELASDFQYRFEAPNERYVGLALYSKIPIQNPHIEHFGSNSPPAIVATLVDNGRYVDLILAHPLPPMNATMAAQRNLQLRAMAEYVRASTRPVVLAGDLNVTMWSPHYIDFIRTSGLTNARDGYGIGGTWPPIPLLGLPIDHILTTKGSWIGDFRVHSGVGSDHLPVSVELTFPDSIKQARYVDAEMR